MGGNLNQMKRYSALGSTSGFVRGGRGLSWYTNSVSPCDGYIRKASINADQMPKLCCGISLL